MKRIIVSLLITSLVPALAWSGGYDFDQRGGEAFCVLLGSIVIFAFAYTAPRWDY